MLAMRTALFFGISAALHAAALTCAAFYNAPEKTPPLIVSIIEAEGGGGGGENSSAAEKAGSAAAAHFAPQKQMKRAPSQNAKPVRTVESAALAETPKTAAPVAIATPAEPIAVPVVETQAQSAINVPVRESAVTIALENAAAASAGIAPSGSTAISNSTGVGSGRGTGTGSGVGSGSGSGGGSGTGTGQGSGAGDGSGEARFVQASYMSCPKADYPESARRQGWEGTVMLEVSIDEEGHPKSSRVERSSGFAVLDSAALDNIQRRCRFHPARRGATRVPTLIRVPVEFRLADNR
ncbi:MAG TPA: energy transducer TonB [Candidatus Binatia bacterium]|jgi:protein TonB